MHRNIKEKGNTTSCADDKLNNEGIEDTDSVDAVNEKEIENINRERKIKDLEEALASKQITINELREAETKLKVENATLTQNVEKLNRVAANMFKELKVLKS